MDDPSRFTSINEYYTFIYAISYMMLVELGIWIYNFKGWLKRPDKKNNDYGTILIVMLGCWGSFYFSTYFRSQQFIQIAGEILLPHIFYYVGIAFILVGTTLRAIAVWSLRHSFTLSVKTGGNQQLVTTGVYRYIRNPAYAGTMLSMLGNAFCFRSVFSPLLVLLVLAICYGIRIKVEEKALYERFGEEFKNYCFRSWRLFPLIWYLATALVALHYSLFVNVIHSTKKGSFYHANKN